MLTSKALVSLLNPDQQQDAIHEIYKQKTILTNDEWDMFVEPWLDELSFARLRRVEGIVKILRRFWKRWSIDTGVLSFYIDKNSKGENYRLPNNITKKQIENSVIYWYENENDWQYIETAFETDYILNDHIKNMLKLGYVFTAPEVVD